MPKLTLFGRIYGLSLLLIAAYTFAIIVISLKFQGFDEVGRASARWLSADLLEDCADRSRLERRVRRLATSTPYRVSIKCEGFLPLGDARRPAPEELTALASSRELQLSSAMLLGTPKQHVLVEDHSALPIGLPWQFIVAQLVALALLSWPVARSLTRPLRQLGMAMAQFGAGALSARAGIHRRDELGDLAHAFDDMAAQLEAQIRAEKLVIAGISHELRTPLHRITSALGALPPAQGAATEQIRQEVVADVLEISALLDDVFLLSRLEGPPMTIERVVRRGELSVASLVEEGTVGLEIVAPEREISVQVPSELAEQRLHADPRLLPRAVRNLIDNAIKYTDRGEILVEVSARRSADHGITAVQVAVSDLGPGIPEALREDVFRPFIRLGDAASGLGLGLALAQAIARAHGGTLEVGPRSDGQAGARFALTLPVAPAGAAH